MRYRHGVIVGKFYPPHRGHQHLIEAAMSACDLITILLCAKEEQVPDGPTRASWLRELYPEADVLVTPDDLPEEPGPWAARTLELAGQPDVVFSSEDYGEPYAVAMRCEHVMVDRDRNAVACSGNEIRRDPLGNLEYLSPVVRAFYVYRVCVLGVESSGTTTLAKALAEEFSTVWVPEYGRMYFEGRMASPCAGPWMAAEFNHIAESQNRMEDMLARVANKVLLCDTDSFTTTLWKERYMGEGMRSLEIRGGVKKHPLYILTAPDFPFVQDGYRDGEHIRIEMHDRFLSELKKTGRNFIVVKGEHKLRLQSAVREVRKLMNLKLVSA